MAIVHIQTKQQAPTSATNASGSLINESFTTTPTVGNLVVVYVSFFGLQTITSVVDNQGVGVNTYTTAVSQANGSVNAAIIWGIPTVASGTFTITVNFSSSVSSCIGISEFSGVATSPIDGTISAPGSGTAVDSGTITPSLSGDLFISVVSDASGGAGNTFTIPSGWNGKRAEQPTGTVQDLSSASLINAGSSAPASLWTDSFTGTWVALMAAFKAAGVSSSNSWNRTSYGPGYFGNPNPVSRFQVPLAYPVFTSNLFTQSLSGTLAFAGNLVKSTSKILSGTLTSSGTLIKQIQRALSGTITTIVGSLVIRTQKVLSGGLLSSGTLIKQSQKIISGTLTSAGSLVKSTLKVLSGTLTSSGTLVKQTLKVLSGVLTSAGSLVKQTRKILSGALTSSGVLTTQKVIIKALAGTLSFAGTLVKQTTKTLSGTLTSSGTLTKQVRKLLSGVLTTSGTIAKLIPKALSGTLSFSGTLTGFIVTLFPPVVRFVVKGKQSLFNLLGIQSSIIVTGKQLSPILTGKQLNPIITGKQGSYLLTNMANKVNLPDLILGDDITISFIFTNPDGSPFNLTSGSVSFAMKVHTFDTPIILQKDTGGLGGITIVDALNGKANLTLNAADTVGLAPAAYDYSAKAYNGSGKKNTQIIGSMTWIDSAGRTM